MEGSDVLQTIAEVAIALTGFTGIVVALGGRAGAPGSGFALVRFRILLAASLAALAFSLMPFFWYNLDISPKTSWTICSALAATFMVPIAVSDVRAFRSHSGEIPAFERRAAPVILLLGASLWVAQLANVFFLQAFGPFLAVPLWFVGFSALSFARLLFTLQSGDPKQAGRSPPKKRS